MIGRINGWSIAMFFKKHSVLLVCVLAFKFSNAFVVFDPVNAGIAKAQVAQSTIQTSKLVVQLAQGAQTVANTLSQVQMAKRNLEKFTNWQDLSGFTSIANKIQQAGSVGKSLGYASGGIAQGLTAMTGDKYSSMSALQDTLISVGRTLDTQSSHMSRQNSAYDKIANGLSDDGLDGTVAVMQGNANLLNALAQQNQDISNKISNLNKIELAKAQNEINEKNTEEAQNMKYQMASLDGLLDYNDNSNFDFTTSQKYKY